MKEKKHIEKDYTHKSFHRKSLFLLLFLVKKSICSIHSSNFQGIRDKTAAF